jgi:hypothetical protein
MQGAASERCSSTIYWIFLSANLGSHRCLLWDIIPAWPIRSKDLRAEVIKPIFLLTDFYITYIIQLLFLFTVWITSYLIADSIYVNLFDINANLRTAIVFVVVDFQTVLYTQRLGMFGSSLPLYYSSDPLICFHQTVSQKQRKYSHVPYVIILHYSKQNKQKTRWIYFQNLLPRNVRYPSYSGCSVAHTLQVSSSSTLLILITVN